MNGRFYFKTLEDLLATGWCHGEFDGDLKLGDTLPTFPKEMQEDLCGKWVAVRDGMTPCNNRHQDYWYIIPEMVYSQEDIIDKVLNKY